jgi:hypothetical protein
MYTDQDRQLKVRTEIYQPRQAEVLLAAARIAGGVEIDVLDPSVPDEAAKFAIASAQEEIEFHDRGNHVNGPNWVPRSPDQIKRDLVSYAIQAGKVLVIIRHNQDDLAYFWEKVDAVKAQS